MKILIVDDHAIVREGVGRLLSETQDALIFEAANGDEALAVLRKKRPGWFCSISISAVSAACSFFGA